MNARPIRLVISLISLSTAIAACASTPEQKGTVVDAIAPPPFSAEEIRNATQEGRTYHFRITGDNVPAVQHRFQFTELTNDGATLTSWTIPEGLKLPEGTSRPVTWGELVGHASYPKAATKIDTSRVTVPAGTFECHRYTVAGDDGSVTVAEFAIDLPGAPVRHTLTSKDGKIKSRMELLEHVASSAK